MRAIRLETDHEAAIEELLLRDPAVNLFLLSVLNQRMAEASWVGIPDETGRMLAVASVIGGLCVPYAPDIAQATELGLTLKKAYEPYMMVGPRAAVDAIWQSWTTAPVRIRYDQRLYVATSADPLAPALDLATPADVPEIAALAVAMQLEDLGTDPREHGEARHLEIVGRRIDQGRTLILRQNDQIVFMVHVGTIHPFGCQIGGTYVPLEHRNRGLATRGVRGTVAHLLQTYPRVTLHVNEANTPAVRVYEKCGFLTDAPYRLLIAGLGS